MYPLTHPLGIRAKTFFVDMINERAEAMYPGELEIKQFAGEQLVKTREMLDACAGGTLDIFHSVTSYYAGKVPEGEAAWLPYAMGWGNGLEAWHGGLGDLMNKWYIKKANARIVFYTSGSEMLVFGTDKPLATLEDFEGLLMRAGGGAFTKTIEALGAKVVSMPSAEVYTALERGTIDSTFWSPSSIIGYHGYEVTNYFTTPMLMGGNPCIFMNEDKWQGLPEHLQDLIVETCIEGEQGMLKMNMDPADPNSVPGLRRQMLEKGMTQVVLPPAELARWQEAEKSVWDWYLTIGGPDAQAMLDVLNKYPYKPYPDWYKG